MDGKFVCEFFARGNGLLADPRDTVLLDRNFQAVPVEACGFGQAIFEDDTDAVALLNLNGGSGAGAVITPDVDGLERSDLAAGGLGGETVYFLMSGVVR